VSAALIAVLVVAVVIVLLLVFIIAVQVPEMRRYFKIRGM